MTWIAKEMMSRRVSVVALCACVLLGGFTLHGADLRVNEQDYLEARGLSVLLFHNPYHAVFGDQKLGGLEIILHGERIATNGDVRLLPTPAQWDAIPHFKERKRGPSANGLTASCEYAEQGLSYRIEVIPEADGFRVTVHLDQPLVASLVGKAGFNLEFLPTTYFGKSFLLDNQSGVFPRHPQGPMRQGVNGSAQPLPLATGNSLVLAAEDPMTRVSITSDNGPLMLFDGRNEAQNGWFVVRSLIAANRTENAVVWHIRPNVAPGWVRPPVVAYNQVGYTPERAKAAVIELDPFYDAPKTARVLRLTPEGEYREAFRGEITSWGKWLRYQYARFDFSAVRESGVYVIEYAGRKTAPFRIAKDVYRAGVWQASLDTYLPVQMDHVKVREAYRIWHGASNLDDARQTAPNQKHFDGYANGGSTDSPFATGDHVPGLNRGGWYDAGDFDIRTQSQARVITDLVLAKEQFGVDWDETTVDEEARLVQIRKPDGIPDAVQQIEHGVLGILGQYKAFGHAIPGIISPTLEQYTHLGDGASETDGRIYSPRMGRLENDGVHSGLPDDRLAFTTRTTPLDYLAISSLAAASRVLHGYNDKMAEECLQTAVRVWDEEHKRPPSLFKSFNTTGGELGDEETKAAVELLIATKGGEVYRKRLAELLPVIQNRFLQVGWIAVRAIPFMDEQFKNAFATALRSFKEKTDAALSKNPYGVPITTSTWGGAGAAAGFATQMYFFHKAFPEIVGPEYTLRGFDYVLGMHPVSNVSYVSSVGTQSKLIAYGNNRADYSFIPGGIIPGVVIVQPDFPELKDDWPFLWFENEYVVDTVTGFILAANAADAVTR